jgi:hypothetical protein
LLVCRGGMERCRLFSSALGAGVPACLARREAMPVASRKALLLREARRKICPATQEALSLLGDKTDSAIAVGGNRKLPALKAVTLIAIPANGKVSEVFGLQSCFVFGRKLFLSAAQNLKGLVCLVRLSLCKAS